MATTTKRMTAEEFELLPRPRDGSRRELVRGEVITAIAPDWRHGEITGNVGFAIKIYLLSNPIGRVTVEGGSVVERDPDTVRGPDVSYMSKERMPLDKKMDCYPEGAPDLCVEVLSPSNTRSHIGEKLEEYFAGGAKCVWVLDPDDHSVTIYDEAIQGRVFHTGASVDGGNILPNFSCPVADFFK